MEPRKEGEGPPPWPLRSMPHARRGPWGAKAAVPPASSPLWGRQGPDFVLGQLGSRTGALPGGGAVQVPPLAPRMDRRGGHSRAGRQIVAWAIGGRDACPLPHSSIQPVVRIGAHLGVFPLYFGLSPNRTRPHGSSFGPREPR